MNKRAVYGGILAVSISFLSAMDRSTPKHTSSLEHLTPDETEELRPSCCEIAICCPALTFIAVGYGIETFFQLCGHSTGQPLATLKKKVNETYQATCKKKK